MPPTEPGRVKDPPKTRLHKSLLPYWSCEILLQRQTTYDGQQRGLLHGYGPPVQVGRPLSTVDVCREANRFVTQFFFKGKSGAWSQAMRRCSSEPARHAQSQRVEGDQAA